MDLALISTLLPAVHSGLTRVLVSYDIGCKWSKKLQDRLSVYSVSSSFKLSSLSYWRVVVPKFHLAGHGKDCQLRFNINLTKGAARMSGEMIESGWAQSGSMAIWTRENGPFARRATLDDHWGSENWRKLRRLRKSIFIPQSPPSTLTLFPRNLSSQKPSEVACVEQDTACCCHKRIKPPLYRHVSRLEQNAARL